ncbi:hypothetical protein [Streptomyces stelliscabiei]|uniref:hypothetical protein n=1 Tax=Streptomyces stelliscabiei TaxID=146820 RepID=UPI0029A75ABC|nr:hypothetical protein [Streptomyces stelliscabiei]MDX2661033.1 hypothetical protein [Streptomyces stelliscabiei]MDX2715900.1 hypothetical protein [Streptomyces stelliscabiei]MDX2790010.1 hypothetical protein [Streptomyces stelliscabiei]
MPEYLATISPGTATPSAAETWRVVLMVVSTNPESRTGRAATPANRVEPMPAPIPVPSTAETNAGVPGPALASIQCSYRAEEIDAHLSQ